MLAFFGNLHMMEMLVIAVAALMIFGRRLPEVAMRGAAQVVRLRRSVTKMWREAGLEEELRKVRRDIDREVQQVERSLPPLTFPDEQEDDPQHEHWRDSMYPEDSAEEDPLAREALDGEPAGEAVRQEGEVDDPQEESEQSAQEPDETDASGETGPLESESSESSEAGTKESA